jgi:hypothetical protein
MRLFDSRPLVSIGSSTLRAKLWCARRESRFHYS